MRNQYELYLHEFDLNPIDRNPLAGSEHPWARQGANQ